MDNERLWNKLGNELLSKPDKLSDIEQLKLKTTILYHHNNPDLSKTLIKDMISRMGRMELEITYKAELMIRILRREVLK